MNGIQINPRRDAIADTGFLLAVMDSRSRDHSRSLEFYDSFAGQIIVPTVLFGELSYMLYRAGGNALVLRALQGLRQSHVTHMDLSDSDYSRAFEILGKYLDTRIDFIDSCVMAIAERLQISRILTFDHRDFGLYRPAHISHFELMP